MRVQVTISEEACPELYADLLHLNPRYRAARLRQLAMCGLASLKPSEPPKPPKKTRRLPAKFSPGL